MTDRKTAVEECLALDVNELIRHGVFRTRLGTPCNWFWSDASGREICRADFSLQGNSAALYLRLSYRTAATPFPISCRIELDSIPCHLGGAKRMFRCPGKGDGDLCGRPVQKLFLVGGLWLCRQCGDLTYLARRQHDRRKDFLMCNPVALAFALESENPRKRLLGIDAYVQAVGRLRKYAH